MNFRLIFIIILFSGPLIGFNGCKSSPQHTVDASYPVKDEVPLSDLQFVNKVFDAGDIYSDTIISVSYELINAGINPLVIYSVTPDCHCTGYDLSSDTISIDDSAELILHFNTENKNGPQKIYTIIKANTEIKFYKLTLKANIHNSLNVDNS